MIKSVPPSGPSSDTADVGEDMDKRFQPDAEEVDHLPDQIVTHWRILLVISGSFLSIIALTACLLYLRLSDQSGEDEIRAARGVADVAMALSYANFKQIQPQNQNRSYAEVIRANLHSILAPMHPSFAKFDAHGQFLDCPYMLRIYESSNLSNFLVIAQPEHGWLYSFMPKPSIVIDSRSMELHKIQDLKSLNRLLVDSQTLDDVNSNEISALAQKGELIPIAKLAKEGENHGLLPPRALSLMHPGSENMVYNAPRYYLFGETLLDSLVALADSQPDRFKEKIVSEELSFLTKYDNFVFYSSKGIEHALEARRSLSSMGQMDNFHVAYLQFNDRNEIVNAHLLMDDESAFIVEREPVFHVTEESVKEEGALQGFSLLEEGEGVDFDDHLFVQMSSMAHTRQLALMPIGDEMINLLELQSHSAQLNFEDLFAKLEQQYLETSRDQDEKMFKKFDVLISEYSYLPAAQFISFIKAADLSVSFESYLAERRNRSPNRQITDQVVSQHLERIEKSRTWSELENIAVQTNQVLQYETIPDNEYLIALQDSAWSAVARKLNEFILPSEASLQMESFTPKDFQSLINILSAVWVINPQIHDFYTGAFGVRMRATQ